MVGVDHLRALSQINILTISFVFFVGLRMIICFISAVVAAVSYVAMSGLFLFTDAVEIIRKGYI